MTLRSRILRLIRGTSSDTPVRLRFDAPTVTPAETARLGPAWAPKPVKPPLPS